ncbi:MAG: hypothetical protein Q4A45_05485 [Clostridia bacterium]|nr:hypothetical protein [Clostridia bacterium]
MSTPKKKGWALPLGIIVIIFAVVGLIVSVIGAVNAVKGVVDNSAKEKETYQKLLIPVVMNDIDEFDDVTKANMSQLIEASVWSIIKSDISTDKYATEDGVLLFPQEDVEKAFTKLFGTDVEIKHQSVTSTAFQFEYDAGKKAYKVPITGVDPTYTPRVLDISKKGNNIILTVAYVSGSDWVQSETGEMVPPEPSKYVKITLRKKDKSYFINSIQSASAPETIKK